jgi:hypothetical protein
VKPPWSDGHPDDRPLRHPDPDSVPGKSGTSNTLAAELPRVPTQVGGPGRYRLTVPLSPNCIHPWKVRYPEGTAPDAIPPPLADPERLE